MTLATKKRLIDAEDLRQEVRDDPGITGNQYRAVMDHILSAKTVDAVEVVHGWWVRGKVNWQMPMCSVCRKQVTAKSNYCPNCGAKMDGDNHG